MRLLTELLITAMETIGLIFVALGLGFAGLAIAGTGGFFLVTGLALLVAAYVSARQQRPPRPPAPPGPPPAAFVSSNGNGHQPAEGTKLSDRLKKVLPKK